MDNTNTTRKARTLLTAEQKSDLIEDLKSGMKLADVAEKYGVSVPTVSKIKKDKGMTRGGSSKAGSTPDTKTISVPTTPTAFENAVKKIAYDYIKDVKGDHDTVEVKVIFTIGNTKYSFSELLEKKKEVDAIARQELAELKAKVAELERKLG